MFAEYLFSSFINILLMLIVGAFFIYFYLKSKRYNYLKRCGYYGPNPSIFKFGNLKDFYSKENSIKKDVCLLHYSKTLYRWSLKYGKIYGYYEVTKPILVISDADMVKRIFIDNKIQHRRSFPMSKLSEQVDADIFLNNGKRWQRVRKCLEKVFFHKTNIIHSYNYLEESFKSLSSTLLNGSSTRRVDIYEKIKAVLVHTMFQLSFGMNLNQFYELHNHKVLMNRNQNQSINNTMLEKRGNSHHESTDHKEYIHQRNNVLSENLARKFDHSFVDFESPSILKVCSLIFEELDYIWHWIGDLRTWLYFKFDLKCMEDALSWFNKQFTRKYYQENLHNYQQRGLLNSFFSRKNKSHSLTSDEIISNSTLMVFAGFETTSTAIAFASHVIANNQDERKKLIKEIFELLKNKNNNNCLNFCSQDLSIDLIKKLKYLDLFVKEVLRMYPIANSMVSRKCVQDDFYIDKNKEYFIPKGINIVVDVLSIHYNKDLWGPEDPFTFYPNRFLQKRHPAAWLAFGVGNRRCLGMKMAIDHIKIVLVRILQHYFIESDLTGHDSNGAKSLFNSIETKEILFNVPSDGVVLLINQLKNFQSVLD